MAQDGIRDDKLLRSRGDMRAGSAGSHEDDPGSAELPAVRNSVDSHRLPENPAHREILDERLRRRSLAG